MSIVPVRAGWPLLVLLCVAACADSGPPPVASLEGRQCTDEAGTVRGNVQPLVIGETKTVAIDETAACWNSPAGTSTYVAFELPAAATPFMISVVSEPVGHTIFVPRLNLRDAQGKVRREIPRNAFLPQRAALYVGIRSHQEDRYLIVASEPSSVSQHVTHTVGTTHVVPMMAGPVMFIAHGGSDATTTYTYAHNGRIKVKLEQLPDIAR